MHFLTNFWDNLRLRSKIATLTSLLVLGTIFALSYVSIERERSNFRQELEEQASLFLKATSLSVRDSLYRLQLDELIDLARLLRTDQDVTQFLVFDDQGRILVDSTSDSITSFERNPNEYGAHLVLLDNNEIHFDWQENQLLAGSKIMLGNQTIGAIATGLSTAELDEKINAITLQGILLAALTLLIGTILTVIFSRQITQPLGELAESAQQMAAGKLTVRVTPRGQDELGRLGTAFNEMAVGLQEREWLRDMFGRFVSQEVAEAIRTGQVKLEGEHRVVSVLFCDIRDFTNFSERHTPQEVVGLLNEFLPVVVQSAQQHGGMVNKFGGDSTLIIYGAPRDIEESAYHAVLTALDIRNGLKALNKHLLKRGETPLRVGVGINTGIALAGAVGPAERQEYTVVGHTVNLAARIDGLNKQFPEHDILISGRTHEALGARVQEFQLRSLGAIPIRGQNEPVEILAVLDKN